MKIRNRVLLSLGGMLLIAGGIGAVYGFGLVNNITCVELEPQQVNCTVQQQWMAVINTSEVQTLTQVRGASVASDCDDEGCSYYVDFVDRNEQTTRISTVNEATARDVVGKLNNMLNPRSDIEADTVMIEVVAANWFLSLGGLACVAVPFLICGFWLLWASIQSGHYEASSTA